MMASARSDRKEPTINDIADALGISRGTVDRVIHGRKGVSGQVRASVLEMAEKLGYRPNRAARMLAARKTPRKIGVLLPSCDNPFFDDVIRGMEKATQEYHDLGFSLVLKQVSGYDETVHSQGIAELVGEKVDSLVLATLDSQSVKRLAEDSGLPFAAVNSDLTSDKKLFYTGPDYRKKGELHAAMLDLCHKGRADILVLKGSSGLRGHDEIVEGFLSGLGKTGLEFSIRGILETGDSDGKAEKLVRQTMSGQDGINVLFIATAGARGAIRGLDGASVLSFANDDTEDVRDLVREGKLYWTITQEPFRQGYESIRRMQDYFIDNQRPSDLVTKNIIKIRQNIGED